VTPTGLRVLAVTNMYPTVTDPSYGSFVASQMDSIAASGVEVTVEFIDGRNSAWRYGLAIAAVRRKALAGGFDLVHAHHGLTGFVASFQPLPLVVSFCGDDILGTPHARGGLTLKSRCIQRLSHFAARRADAIICKAHVLRDRLPREANRKRAFVIPNGVDTSRFWPGDRSEARARLHLDPSERLILFPSTPTERRKRLDRAEAAVGRLRARGVGARLLVVQRVPPAHMPDYYRAADCLLLTSEWEGSPNVVKEAICCDLPVVSVDVGDVARWSALAPGCRIVGRDPEEIAQALVHVVTHVPHVNGHRVREAVSLPTIAREVLSVYDVARRGWPGGGT
jgi:glycosyltransferase involved in cell wall biosynthesis